MKPKSGGSTWMVLVAISVATMGCYSPLMRSQSPGLEDAAANAPADERPAKFVGDVAVGFGMGYQKVEGVGLVTGLRGTGSDPAPSPLRSELISEIQSHEVDSDILKSNDNSLVVVKAYLPPGIQKGEHFDVVVKLPLGSKTTSLRGGWLMPTRLKELRLLDNVVRSGHVLALAGGNVAVDAVFEGDVDEVHEIQGRVLGGGQATKSRQLGLVIRSQYARSSVSPALGTAINARFHHYDRGDKRGVATPLRNDFVELAVHPRYKRNVTRYMAVIRSIAYKENTAERLQRMAMLENKLLEPTTSARAALELEAIGDEAIRVLKIGLRTGDPEVRFYSAEALAYMDVEEAVAPLAEAAEKYPAFRYHALTALTTMDHVAAYDALNSLLHVSSAETRYGAFRALRIRNPNDPLVRGEIIGDGFSYHVISTTGPPLIHISRSRRPELVVFGYDLRMQPPAFLFAGKQIMLKGLQNNQIKLSRFAAGAREDQHEVCEATVDAVVRSICRLNGGYGNVLEALTAARDSGYLECKLVVDAVARPGRKYHRDEESDEDAEGGGYRVASPLPEMFRDDPEDEDAGPRPSFDDQAAAQNEDPEKKPGMWSKMTGWLDGR